jgi:uncharacterized protein YjiS (DUF1127 family)
MTTTTLLRLATTPERPNRLFGFFSAVIGGVIEAREIEARYNQLSHMSNAELAALGLSRQDIPRAAVFGLAAR